MKVLKDDIYNSILLSARNEFITNGFKDTSMRIIARKANVGLSNIYNYFKNKDEIFLEVIKPAKSEMFNYIAKLHSEDAFNDNKNSIFGHQEDAIDYYIYLIYKYKEEFCLLLYHSQGSSMSNFRDMFTDYLTQISYDYLKLEKKYYPKTKKISGFFIHAMSSWMVSILGEIVTHDLDKEKIRKFFREYFRFGFAGWKELTGI